MNILILGATSNTGQALLKRLTKTEAQLTAYVRSMAKLPTNYNYQVVAGNMLDLSTLTQTMHNQDIVIAGLSGETLLEQAHNLVEAATQAQVKHLYWITGIGIHHEITGSRGEALNQFVDTMPTYIDAADTIAQSSVPSTLLRLPAITNGPATEFEITFEGQQPTTETISRATLADALVALINDNTGKYDNSSIAICEKGAD